MRSAQYNQIFMLERQINGHYKLLEYQSQQDLRAKRLLKNRGSSLQGCLERTSGFGHIWIKPFSLSIKGLDNNYDF